MLLPRVFHRVWLGGKPMPELFARWGQSWLDTHPTWTMRTWSEPDVERLTEVYPWLPSLLYRCPHYSQQSNVLRYVVINLFGGVYLDTDFEAFKSIEPLIYCVRAFAGMQLQKLMSPHSIAPGLFGAVAGHPFTEDLVSGLPKVQIQKSRSAGPEYFTAVARRHSKELLLIPRKLLYPYNWSALHRAKEHFPEAYAAHHWSSMWHKDSFGGEIAPAKSPWTKDIK